MSELKKRLAHELARAHYELLEVKCAVKRGFCCYGAIARFEEKRNLLWEVYRLA